MDEDEIYDRYHEQQALARCERNIVGMMSDHFAQWLEIARLNDWTIDQLFDRFKISYGEPLR